MVRRVSYGRQTVDSVNPAKRVAHRARLKRAVSIANNYLEPQSALLDFGAGPGKFLKDVEKIRTDVTLFGYDKFKNESKNGLNYVKTLGELPNESIDVLTAFEVLEHVIDEDLESFIREAKRLLTNSGTLIVSVPIMYGPIVLVKEASQMISRRRRPEYSLSEFVRVLAGSRIARPPTIDRYQTHKGFDFRQLRQRLSKEFFIEKEILSPFPLLPWMLNSQFFAVAKRKPVV